MAQCVKVLAPKLDDLYSISKVPHGGKTDSYKMSCEFHMGITPPPQTHMCAHVYMHKNKKKYNGIVLQYVSFWFC